MALGEFEYLLITAAAGLGENAYGAAIRDAIEAATERTCSIGALYTTIERLETKGLLEVLGLVARWELLPWKNWRPWAASFGLALPFSLTLMGLSVSISWFFQH